MNKNFFIALLLLVSCGSSDEVVENIPELLPATSLSAKDVANFGNGSDIQITFNKPTDLSIVEEFRVFVVPEEVSSNFDSTAAINGTHYYVISKNGSSTSVNLNEDQADSNGDLVVEDKSYTIYVMTMGIVESGLGGALSSPSSSFTLMQKNVVRTLTNSLSEGSGGMDADGDGNIYMADFGLATNNANGSNVIKITPEGSVSNYASGFAGASGNDFDDEGNLYQSNIGGNTVSKIARDGTVTTFATGLVNPVGIAFDGNSAFYVCNCGNNTIAKIDMQGNVSQFSASTLLNCPNGIDIDENGNLYIANFSSSTIVKITPSGNASAFVSMPGNNNGHLLINGDFIYVVSRGLHQIHKVSFSGAVSLVAGNGARGIVDGPLNEASFSLPNDIAFSPDGRYIYVNDVNGSDPNVAVISPTIIRVIELVE
ncbi:MAG: SMP-30/gluconolactonase/LRE family protein [Bacteroidota bacterium]